MVAVVTAALAPIAPRMMPDMPGFVAAYQSALITAYALATVILFSRFAQDRCKPLLVLGSGSFFTLLIVFLQLLSFPKVFAPSRVFGSGPDTTVWLWTFWHIGPPGFTFVYALVARSARKTVDVAEMRRWLIGGTVAALLLGGACAMLSTTFLQVLPKSVNGDDYTLLVTSGVGPCVQALTVAALALLWRQTGRTLTFLELWLVVSLALLIADNTITFLGAARNTVGWFAGRMEALVSAWAIVAVYLLEIDSLHRRAQASESHLREAQRMESIGKLTGGVAHDFNNLLMVLVGSLEAIQRRPEDKGRVLKMAEHGLGAAQRGARLTAQLLTFACKQPLCPEPIVFNDLLRSYDSLLRRAAGETISVDFFLDPDLRPVHLDVTQLEAALMNLVVNARDALPNGGSIAVSARNVSIGAKDRSCVPPGEYVAISVTDTGAGMPPEVIARAVEPFFTTKSTGKGSGLGLSQVYGFVKSSGGDIEIASTVGAGTSVHMFLPAYSGPVGAKQKPETPVMLGEDKPSGRVLVVEDDTSVAHTTSETLKELGYDPIVSANATEAMRVLKSERVDILFSDVVMPGTNGIQLAEEARRVCPGIRILLTSGYVHTEHGGAVNGGKTPLLKKPYRREELAHHLRLISASALGAAS